MEKMHETTPFRCVQGDLEETQTKRERSTWKQVILALVAYSASLAPSMSIGFSAVAIPALQNDTKSPFTVEQVSWFASIASIATPLGCLFSGPASDRFGRKPVLLMVNFIAFLGWITIAIGMDLNAGARYPTLLAGRLLTGFSTGFASMPPVVYMSEVSTARLRGVFTTANGVFFAIGILGVYVLGAIFPDACGTVALLTALIPCVSLVLVTFALPETPQWLVAHDRVADATRSMQRIYYARADYTRDIYDDIQALVQRRNATVPPTASNLNLRHRMLAALAPFRRATCYKPFILVQTFFFFQQFTGTFVIVFYAIDIVAEARVTDVQPYIAIVLIAFTRLIGAILVSYISRHYGRRPISLLSGIGMTVCMCILAIYVREQWQGIAWLPLACLLVYFFTSTLGFITMPFALAAECFPAEIKGTVTGVITCCAYLFNFVVVKTYPAMIAALGAFGTFMCYGVFSAAGTAWVYFFLPETRGKTLAEIEDYFRGKPPQRAKDEGGEEKMLKS